MYRALAFALGLAVAILLTINGDALVILQAIGNGR